MGHRRELSNQAFWSAFVDMMSVKAKRYCLRKNLEAFPVYSETFEEREAH
jgi:hypothetical protein